MWHVYLANWGINFLTFGIHSKIIKASMCQSVVTNKDDMFFLVILNIFLLTLIEKHRNLIVFSVDSSVEDLGGGLCDGAVDEPVQENL